MDLRSIHHGQGSATRPLAVRPVMDLTKTGETAHVGLVATELGFYNIYLGNYDGGEFLPGWQVHL